MKKTVKFMICLLVLWLIFSCSSDDDGGSSIIEFSPELLNGTWKISFFSDENSVRTAEFNSYRFTFNVAEEEITITSNGNTEFGGIYPFQDEDNGVSTWVLEMDFRSANNPGDADLQDLDEDWIVRKFTDNPLILELEERISNNAPEILHLEKLQ